MKILAREQTMDLYNCDIKRLSNIEEIKQLLLEIFGKDSHFQYDYAEEKPSSIIGIFPDGHIAIHVYRELRYVAVDIFICSVDIETEEFSKRIQKFFLPTKIKTIFLKRGDFGLEREIKPKIKSKISHLRRVKNVSSKVLNKLVRRNK